MRKIACLIAVIALLLCACTAQMTVNKDTQINATDPSTGESAGQTEPSVSQQTDPTTTGPAVTVPLVPENSDYTGPTLDASEGVEDWGDNNGNNNGNTNSTEATKPEETTPPATQPTMLTWEQYLALTPAQKEEHDRRVFGIGPDADEAAYDALYDWIAEAKAEYEKSHPNVGGDGIIDIGDYMGNGN